MTSEEAVKNLEKLKLSLMDSLQKTFYLPETKEDMQSVFDFFSDMQDIILNQTTVVRCKDCIYAEQTMFDNEFNCYFDEENESGCKRTHKGNWFCADGVRKDE